MTRLLKIGWAVLIALAILITSAYVKAYAQEVYVGTGIVCDTSEQVAKFATTFDGDNDAALQVANSESPSACGILAVAYVRGETVATVQTKNGPAVIVKIAVVAINLGHGWMQGPPMTQYTMFLTREEKS